MNVLLTGATGLIGRYLVQRLHRDGHRIDAWVRDEQRARALLGRDVGLFSGPIAGVPLVEAIGKADAVINLAGAPLFDSRWNKKRQQVLVDSRVELTQELVAAMAASEHKPSVLISASAVGYYGDAGSRKLDEASPAGSDFLAELCALWERAAVTAQDPGIRVVLLRIGLVLDTQGGVLGKLLPIFRMGLGGVLGDGQQYMPWIHIDDLLEIFIRAMSDPQLQGPLNAVAPRPVTNRDFTRSLGRTVQRPTVFSVPAAALKLFVGGASQALLGGQRALPTALEQAGFQFLYSDLEEALSELVHPSV